MATFNMFDLTRAEYAGLFKKHPNFFSKVNGCFYLKNDKKESLIPGVGVRYARCDGNVSIATEILNPENNWLSIGLYYRAPDLTLFKTASKLFSDGIVDFYLKDGITKGYATIMHFEGKDVIAILLDNKNGTISRPFSERGRTSYKEALKESRKGFRNLPRLVESDSLLQLFPDNILKIMRVDNFRKEECERKLAEAIETYEKNESIVKEIEEVQPVLESEIEKTKAEIEEIETLQWAESMSKEYNKIKYWKDHIDELKEIEAIERELETDSDELLDPKSWGVDK